MDKRDIVACYGDSRAIISPRTITCQTPFWAEAKSDPLRKCMVTIVTGDDGTGE